MPQDVLRGGDHVLDGDSRSCRAERTRARARHERLHGARTRAIPCTFVLVRREHELRGVTLDVRCDQHLAHQTAELFDALGVQPLLGRALRREDSDPGADPVVMLGEGLWKSRYGAAPSIVGRVIRINDVPTTVVGVMPERMKFPDADLWVPLSRLPGLAARRRDERFGMQAFGRLAPGVSARQAGDFGHVSPLTRPGKRRKVAPDDFP